MRFTTQGNGHGICGPASSVQKQVQESIAWARELEQQLTAVRAELAGAEDRLQIALDDQSAAEHSVSQLHQLLGSPPGPDEQCRVCGRAEPAPAVRQISPPPVVEVEAVECEDARHQRASSADRHEVRHSSRRPTKPVALHLPVGDSVRKFSATSAKPSTTLSNSRCVGRRPGCCVMYAVQAAYIGGAPCAVRKAGYFGPIFPDGQGDTVTIGSHTQDYSASYSVQRLR